VTVQQIRERYNRLRDSSDIPDKTARAFSTEDVGKLLAEIDRLEDRYYEERSRWNER